MSYEENLRRQLERSADALPMPERDPSRAVDRARRRRNNRRAVVAVTAVMGVLAIGTPLALGGDEAGDRTTMADGTTGLVPTGPLDLTWSTTDDGLGGHPDISTHDDGAVYTLSTGPGVTYDEDCPDQVCPMALYRLNDDGTWTPVSLDGDRPRANDVAAANDLLYASSTGVAAGDDEVVRLSTSNDQGDTWTTEDMPAVDPPSDYDWQRVATASVESDGSMTLALVSTQFSVDAEALFGELAAEDTYVEYADEGVQLIGPPAEEPPTTEPEAAPSGAVDPAEREAAEREAAEATEGEVLRTVPWSDLGVDGRTAVNPVYQVFRHTGDGWEEVDDNLDGRSSLYGLRVAGGRFVIQSWSEGSSSLLTSTDGATWSEVSLPAAMGEVGGVGPALVNIDPYESRELHVSGDGGTTWSAMPLEDAGVRPDEQILTWSGGPLGIALVVGPDDGGAERLVVSADLVDWTSTPLDDLISGDRGEYPIVIPYVGADKIVVQAHRETNPPPGPSWTVVGTPRR